MVLHGESPDQARRRRERDLDDLRALAWLVMRDRYNREEPRVDGGRRGKARIRTMVYYIEAADWREAVEAVEAIKLGGAGRAHSRHEASS